MTQPIRRFWPVSWTDVQLTGGLLERRHRVNRERTLPIELEQLRETGRLASLEHNWDGSPETRPHQFWDSDIAKWIEACAYSLARHDDPGLRRAVDEAIDNIACNQADDGYFNTYFQQVAPDKRWTDLAHMHELYCAGHLIEAAVACSRGLGDDKLLGVMQRYADYIDRTFGPGDDRRDGAPGHQEIELALVKLYHQTGQPRYLELSTYFIDRRGPEVFDDEARRLGRDPHPTPRRWDYLQGHLPARSQTTVEGHCVRANYMYAGMADVAAETGDTELLETCRALWHNMTRRRMYVTGGIGSTRWHERFTFDYDLPPETAYAETCAQIALVLFGHRMLQVELDRDYGDVIERALYNGILSGVSLDGTRFLYDNWLQVCPPAHPFRQGQKPPVRQAWFGCACCPPNVARLLASLGQYIYTTGQNQVAVHLYTASRMTVEVDGVEIALEQSTDYPFDERVTLSVNPSAEVYFSLGLRLPAWCHGPGVKVNDTEVDLERVTDRGYALIERTWSPGDVVELTLPMPVERIQAHPRVRHAVGKVALMRGPLVYCIEEVDNGPNVFDIRLPRDAEITVTAGPDELEGMPVLRTTARHRNEDDWDDDLYRPVDDNPQQAVELTAVPYFAWGNRTPGEMTVWIEEDRS